MIGNVVVSDYGIEIACIGRETIQTEEEESFEIVRKRCFDFKMENFEHMFFNIIRNLSLFK